MFIKLIRANDEGEIIVNIDSIESISKSDYNATPVHLKNGDIISAIDPTYENIEKSLSEAGLILKD